MIPGISRHLVLCTLVVLTGRLSWVSEAAETGLLSEVRAITASDGLAAAKTILEKRFAERDDSGGALERRVIRTTRNASLALPDSLAAMPLPMRARTALAIVPGTRAGNRSGKDRTRDCLRGAEAASREMGFATYFLDTEARGTIEQNEALIAGQMRRIFEDSDSVIIVMLSKGAHDVIRFLEAGGSDLPLSSRRKLAAVISLAGTTQGSVVADWMASSPRPLPTATRAWLRLSGQGDSIEMLRSISSSAWNRATASGIGRRYPNLTWISIAMIPDGEDARITERLWAPGIRKRIEKTSPYFSPVDGLIESAASVLPEDVDVPEWIVAAYGSHAMPNGTYRDGTRIAPQTTVVGEEKLKPETGGEVISAYLRAIPRSILD
jgi:hypothetical protein